MPDLHLGRFDIDATPPKGHPLCGGWIKPVESVDDPLSLRGIVLQGSDQPIVLAALDWTGVTNESHRLWTEALADAAHTTPDRVALHCVHQHNAPFVDREANRLLKRAGSSTFLYDEVFFSDMIARSARAVRDSITASKPVTHFQTGEAEVKQVASNRRVIGPDGKIQFTRYSATKDPAMRAAPEGTIDPFLKSVTFYQNDRPLARLAYYTTHPMSYYGDGKVSSDFVGLARARRQADEPDVSHIAFTGCAGNVTAGKYNTGTPDDRRALTDRVYAAMVAADTDPKEAKRPIDQLRWTVHPHRFAARADLDADALGAIANDPKQTTVNRHRGAMTLAWLTRVSTRRPILLGTLDLGSAKILHLPAETFVEYQLSAQKLVPGQFLATAAYGDGGPWYIPLQRSYAEGGYEPSVSFVAETSETHYRDAIALAVRGQSERS